MARGDPSDPFDTQHVIELAIPEEAESAAQAIEVIRAFVADGSLFVSLDSEVFEARGEEWGRLLGQIAHHIARAARLQGQADEGEMLGQIRRAFEAAIPAAQPTMSGAIKGRSTH